MAHSTLAELQKKNGDLCQLVIRLGTIILRNVAEQRELAGIRGSQIAPQLLVAITPVGIVSRLREASMRCSELSRDCCDGDAACTLEGLGVELATEAETFEALLRVPGPEE
jgi:hypothetical protein